MTRLAEVARRLGHTKTFARIAGWLAPRVDRWLHRVTGGRMVSLGQAVVPTLLLCTIGRKSGQERANPVQYLPYGDGFVIVGSNWGRQHHPAWSSNLLANPTARVQVRERVLHCRGRLATREEHDALWPRLLEVWPAYASYRERSGRDLRVFVLEPI